MNIVPATDGARQPRRRSLRYKFALAISGLVALVLLANALVLVYASRNQLRHDIERRAESYAELAVRPICEAYETYYRSGYSKFKELINEVVRLNPDLHTLAIHDTGGRLLFDYGEFARDIFGPETRASETAGEPRLVGAVKGLERRSWNITEETGVVCFRVVQPYIEEWGRHRYSVVFDVSYESLREEMTATAWRIAWLTGGSLLLGVLFAILLAAQSLGPVEELTSGARDLAQGRLNRRLSIASGDEFEELAGAFNRMAARLTSTIADLEASNRALHQSNVELKELDRLKTDLLANVSHELRTPLTAIQGYTEALAGDLLGELGEAQKRAVSVMGRNTQRLMGMINELLSYARLESRKVELELRSFDVRTVAEQVVGAAQASRGPELDLSLVCEGDLPQVYGDSYRISQVLDNLITNAVKFTPEGGKIEVRLEAKGQEVEVSVEDTGVGIPEEVRSKIFDRFFQADSSSTRRFGGIGLGLSIVRQILDAHGSTMEVESQVGVGTVFRFRLRAAEDGRQETGAATGMRIALIDDDPDFTRNLRSFLTRRGFLVQQASTLAAGLRIVESSPPDLILLDRLLPDGDGFDLLAQLKARETTRRIPVLMVSVLKESGVSDRLGASGYLVKPLEPAAIHQRILEILGSAAGYSPLVLMVQGDRELSENLCKRLRAEGIRVKVAETGTAVLQAIEEEIPALLVIDLATRDMNGWEVLRKLREEKKLRTLPAIVLADGEGDEEYQVPREIEVLDRVNRPLDLSALVEEIERAVAQRSGSGAER